MLKGTSHHSQNGQKRKRDTGERTSDPKRKFLPNMENRVKQVVRRIVKEREKNGLTRNSKISVLPLDPS
jgi:ribosome-binding protein aMBF1 (putative translation factor)